MFVGIVINLMMFIQIDEYDYVIVILWKLFQQGSNYQCITTKTSIYHSYIKNPQWTVGNKQTENIQ